MTGPSSAAPPGPQDPLYGVQVHVVLYETVRPGTGRSGERRLVLRRTVVLPVGDGEEWVEQLWMTGPGGHATSAEALRALFAQFDAFMLGRTVSDLGPFDPPTAATLEKLVADLDVGRVDLPLILVATVDDLDGRPEAVSIDLGAAPSLLGRLACSAVAGVSARLSLVPASRDPEGDGDGEGSDHEMAGEGAQPRDGGAARIAPQRGLDDPSDPSDARTLDAGDVARIALRRDLDDALARATETYRWLNRPHADLVPVSGPSWLRADWERVPGAIGRPLDPADDCVVAVLIGVEGGQVGFGNTQVNLYRYRLEPLIDLPTLLANPGVREALLAVATAATPQAHRDAAAALRSASVGGVTDWGAGATPVGPPREAVSGSVDALGGTVVLCDCRGVQVGNHGRQDNTFASVLAPTVAAAELLRESPALVEALIGFACGDVPVPTLRTRLADAVCGAAAPELDRASAPSAVPFGSIVENVSGLSVGLGAHQTSMVDTVAAVPDVTIRAVERVREQLAGMVHQAEERVAAQEEQYRQAAEWTRREALRSARRTPMTRPPDPPSPAGSGRSGPSIGP